MNKLKKLFQMKFSQKELRTGKKIIASIMLPIIIFQMTSMNFLAMELMKANAEEVVAVPVEEEKKEEIKEEKKVEEKVEVKTEIKTEEKKVEEKVEIVETKTAPEVVAPKEEVKIIDDKKVEVEIKAEIKTEEVKKEIGWVVDGVVASMEKVELNKIYKAPQNEKVTVTFTKLPEIAGSLVIKEIKLTTEEKKSLGALGDTAYDITSDMTNGTFEYNLTLPYPDKDNDGKAEILGDSKKEVKAENLTVLYTEGDELKQKEMKDVKSDKADGVEKQTNKTGKVLEIKGLDHFTIFVVTAPPVMTDPVCSAYPAVFSCVTSLQTAIDSSIVGGTIMVSGGTYNEATVTVNKNLTFEISDNVVINGNFIINSGSTLTFEGHGKTVEATGAFTNSGMISSMTSTSGNVVLQSGGNFTVGDISAIANISITSASGNILDDGVQTTTIDAGGAITLSAVAGNIGAVVSPITAVSNFNNAIDVEAGTGLVQASALGNISVTEASSVNVILSKYQLTSNTAGSYVALGNLTAAGNLEINYAMDSDAKIALMALGNITFSLAHINSSDEVGIYAKGNVTMNDLLTVSGASGTAIIKAGFDVGTGSILDDGNQTTTITAKNITLNATGGTVSSVTSGAGGVIDFFGAVDVALGGGILTTSGGYVTETGGAKNGTYTLNGGNLSISKVFSGVTTMTSANGKMTISDDASATGTVVIGEYAVAVPGALVGAVPFGTYYDVQSTGVDFPVQVTLNYAGDLVGLTENQVTGVYYNDGTWKLYPGATVDTGTDTISFSATHFTPMVGGGDTLGPVISQVAPVTTPTNDNKPDYTFTTNEAGTISYGGDCSSVTTSATSGNNTITLDAVTAHASLADGLHDNCTITVTDAVGNISNILDVSDFTVDTVLPTLTVVLGTDTPGPVKTDIIKVTVADDRSGIDSQYYGFSGDDICDINDGMSNDFDSEIDFPIAGDHTNYLCVKASDMAGNMNFALVGKLNTDNTAPVDPTNVHIATDEKINNSEKAVIHITGTAEANALVELSLTDSAVIPTVKLGSQQLVGNATAFDITIDGTTATAFIDGEITSVITATDAVGNESGTTTSFAVQDTVAPTLVSFTSTKANGTYGPGTAINITATYDENIAGGSVLNVTLNTGSVIILDSISGMTISGTYTVGATSTGQNTTDLTVSNIVAPSEDVDDLAGNTQAGSAVPLAPNNIADTKNIEIDTTAPAVVIVSPTTTDVVNGAVAITFTDDNLTSAQCSIDDTVWVACTTGVTTLADVTGFVALGQGNFTLYLKDTDAVGNVGTSSRADIVKDTVAPVFSSVTPLSDTAINNVTNASDIAYTLSESLTSGTITIARTSGVADVNHTCTLRGTALGTGARTINFDDVFNSCSEAPIALVSGSIYTFTFTGTDEATNSAIPVVRTNVIFDTANPVVDAGVNKIENNEFNQDATVTEALSGIVTYAWTNQTPGVGIITFGTASAEDTTILADTDGVYTIRLTATDGAGNSSFDEFDLTWDATAPTVNAGTDVFTNALPYNAINATVDASIAGVATYAWAQTAGPGVVTFADSTIEDVDISGVTLQGSYTLQLTVTDLAGNTNTDTMTFVYDTTVPEVYAGTNKAKNALFNQDATTADPLAGIATYSWTQFSGPGSITFGSANAEDTTISADTDGTYEIRLTVTDRAGNNNTNAMTLVWDATAPTVDAGANVVTNVLPSALDATVDASVSGVSTYLWEQTAGPGTVTFSATNIEDPNVTAVSVNGVYTLRLTVTDLAGNSASDTLSFTYDNIAPTTAITDPLTGDYKGGAFSIIGTATDGTGTGVASVQVKIQRTSDSNYWNGAEWVAGAFWNGAVGTDNWNIGFLGLGADTSYAITSRATDSAGNVQSAGLASISVLGDVSEPTSAISAPANGSFLNVLGAISGTASDARSGIATVEITIQRASDSNYWTGADWGAETPLATTYGAGNWTKNADLPVWVSGETYTVKSTAWDAVDNSQGTPASSAFTFDNIAPTVTVANLETNDTTPTLTGTVNDNTATINVTIDGVSHIGTNNVNGTWTYTWPAILAEGTFSVTVTATDPASNVGTDGTNSELIIDTTNPSVNAGSDKNVNALFTQDATVTDNLSGIASFAWTDETGGAGTITFGSDDAEDTVVSADTEGVYTIRLTVFDEAGNSAFDEFTLVWDATDPTITLNAPNAFINDDTPTLTGNAVDGATTIVSVEYEIDGNGTWLGATASDGAFDELNEDYTFTTASLLDGAHTIKTRATDNAGNIVDAGNYATQSFTLDTVAPTAPAYISSEGGTVWHRVNPLLDIDFADNVKINTVEYKVNAGGVYQTIATGINALTYTADWSMDNAIWTAMAEGSNYLYFRTTDYAGNQYLTENDTVQTVDIDAAFTIKKDVTAPNAPTYVTAENSWYAANPTLDINFADARAIQTVEYQLDGTGGAWTTLAGVLSGTTYTIDWNVSLAIWNGLIDGSHDIYFRVTDDAGNTHVTADQSGAFTFRKDITAPTAIANLTSDPAVNTWSVDNTVAFNWDDSIDAGVGLSGYSYVVDHVADTTPDSVVENATSAYTTGALADGADWYFHVKALDTLGNVTAISHAGPFKIDTTDPTINHTTVTEEEAGVDIHISANVTDAGSGIKSVKVYYKHHGDDFSSYDMTNNGGGDYSYDIPDEENASYIVDYYIKALDNVDNDATDGSSGSPHAIDITPASATHFTFIYPMTGTRYAGTWFTTVIQAEDQFGNVATGFSGTGDKVVFTTDEAVSVIVEDTVTNNSGAFDGGTWAGRIKFGTGGVTPSGNNIVLTATDSDFPGKTGTVTMTTLGINFGTIAGVESNGSDGSQVQGDQAPADQGVLDDGVVKDGSPVASVPWYKSLPFEIIAILALIGSTIWWWIRRQGANGGVGGFGSFVFTTLKTAASRARMFLW
jgi:hypothetical protein